MIILALSFTLKTYSMKKRLHSFLYITIGSLLLNTAAIAQTGLAPDQNPNFMESQNKYMYLADSLNAFHSTTIQDTYKAIDFLADKREARAERRAFRRELRMARALYGGYYYDRYYYNDYYTPYYYNNYYPYYSRRHYYSGWNGNFYRNALPLAVTLGTIGWWLCR